MKTLLATILIALALMGCTQQPDDTDPSVIREVDGCKVYSFRANGYTHYFTRCGSSVSTERNWSERHGKTTVHKTEVIPTGTE